MREIRTKVGTIYLEKDSGDYKVRILDSHKRYMDYIEVETFEDDAEENGNTFSDAVERYITALASSKTVDALVEQIHWTWELISDDWAMVANYFNENAHETLYSSPESLLENEWVNKIGDYYVVICEN